MSVAEWEEVVEGKNKITFKKNYRIGLAEKFPLLFVDKKKIRIKMSVAAKLLVNSLLSGAQWLNALIFVTRHPLSALMSAAWHMHENRKTKNRFVFVRLLCMFSCESYAEPCGRFDVRFLFIFSHFHRNLVAMGICCTNQWTFEITKRMHSKTVQFIPFIEKNPIWMPNSRKQHLEIQCVS